MSTVEFRGFSWRHAGRRAFAVRDVELRIERGERVLLLGPSGAGKSTLLAALAGLLSEDSGDQSGTVLIDGADARARRDRVGILFQDPQTQLVMARAGDDVAFGLENRAVPPDEIWPRVDNALATVGFAYGRGRRVDTLSGGEQQRLALAGTLAPQPSLLLLDEPTANLDPSGAALIRESVARTLATHDTTMVLVEHRVADALSLVDRVVALSSAGSVVADGKPDHVFREHGESLAAQGVWLPGQHAPRRSPGRTGGAALLTATGVGYRHPATSAATLSDVDIEVRAGETVAVVGENGSGKSTLALLLGGLLRPSHGVVMAAPALTDGSTRLASRPPHRWRADALARRIGSVFQNPEHQFVTPRVYDELALGPRRTGSPPEAVTRTVAALLDRLRLAHLADANPFTLSGGEQRRLSVATALATAPRLLVLDEPTFGQDLRTWRELLALCGELRDDGRGLVVVTHDTAFVDSLADQVLTLHNGLLERDGTSAALPRGAVG